MVDDFRADAGAAHRIVASVYQEVQSFARTWGPDWMRPIGEIEFANGVGAMCDAAPCRVAAAIVGYADLRFGDRIAGLFDRALAAAPDRLRGFREGFRHLAPHGLSFDATVFHHQLGDISALACDFPDTTLVLDHIGLAFGTGTTAAQRQEVFVDCSEALRDLARPPNVFCKIGGLGMPFRGFGLEHRTEPIGHAEQAALWRPYVETAIEAFGLERCMIETNFPPDARSCGYVPLWNALKHITRGYAADERRALFHGTAAKVFRINMRGVAP